MDIYICNGSKYILMNNKNNNIKNIRVMGCGAHAFIYPFKKRRGASMTSVTRASSYREAAVAHTCEVIVNFVAVCRALTPDARSYTTSSECDYCSLRWIFIWRL